MCNIGVIHALATVDGTSVVIEPRQMMLLAVVVAAVSLMVITTRRRLRDRGTPPRAYAREQVARIKEQQGVKGDMETLLAQLQELARDVNAQLDTKFVKLETILRDADERIATLSRLAGESKKGGGDVMIDGSATSQPAIRDRHAKVYELAAAGKSIPQIAQATGRTRGEIELILNLRQAAEA